MRGFVVTLSDGQVFREENGFTWHDLKSYLQNNKHLRIAEMYLQFDHQLVYLPNYARVYFYSKRVEAYLGSDQPAKHAYGIGASTTGSEQVNITWYDGQNGKEETRPVQPNSPAYIMAP